MLAPVAGNMVVDALRNGVRSVADLYDMQLDPGLQEEMTYASPTDGEPVGLSFLIPRTVEDLERRRAMMTRWAWSSCGMMARTPDFLNVAITAWAGGAEYFGQNRPEFKKNVLDYYEFIRENDITLTHTLVNLQKSRIPGMADNLDEQVALTVMPLGFGLYVINTIAQTTLQRLTPEALRGRVFTVQFMMASLIGLAPLLIAATLADIIGIPAMLFWLSVGCLLVGAFSIYDAYHHRMDVI